MKTECKPGICMRLDWIRLLFTSDELFHFLSVAVVLADDTFDFFSSWVFILEGGSIKMGPSVTRVIQFFPALQRTRAKFDHNSLLQLEQGFQHCQRMNRKYLVRYHLFCEL